MNQKLPVGILLFLFVSLSVGVYLVGQKTTSFNGMARQETEKDEISQLYPLHFPEPEPVYHTAITATITLTEEVSFLRFILIDNKGEEYLVYETSPLFSEQKNISANNVCEETCLLAGIVPQALRVEGYRAGYKLKKISFRDKSGKNYQSLSPEELALERETLLRRSETRKIETINRQIGNKKLKWTAGQTSVSPLTYAEKKKLFFGSGSDKVLPNLQGFEYYKGGIFEIKSEAAKTNYRESNVSSSDAPLPLAWDWRNVHGENWMTPVQNQGRCGSCWAFGPVAALEANLNLYYNRHLDFNLSEQEIVSCARQNGCAGGLPLNALDYLKNNGVADELCFRYRDDISQPCESKCQGSAERKISIADYTHSFEPFSIVGENSVKQSLVNSGVAGVAVLSWNHVMALVGYDWRVLSERYWIFKNSWGDGWGENGYAKVIIPSSNLAYFGLPLAPFALPENRAYWPPGLDGTIRCVDQDNDRYCQWGISRTKPANCPSSCREEKDCDDSSADLVPLPYGGCGRPMATITPTPTSIPECIPMPGNKPCQQCDADGDGFVCRNDLEIGVGRCFARPVTGDCRNFDLTGDCKIDVHDIIRCSSGSQCYNCPSPTPEGLQEQNSFRAQ